MVIDEIGGRHGVRDHRAVLSTVALPKQNVFGKELYPNIFLKAAIYTRGIIMNHPFIDGNKRTGVSAAAVFLEDNGYKVLAKKGELEKLAMKVIKQKLSVEDIAQWFEKHAEKVKR